MTSEEKVLFGPINDGFILKVIRTMKEDIFSMIFDVNIMNEVWTSLQRAIDPCYSWKKNLKNMLMIRKKKVHDLK